MKPGFWIPFLPHITTLYPWSSRRTDHDPSKSGVAHQSPVTAQPPRLADQGSLGIYPIETSQVVSLSPPNGNRNPGSIDPKRRIIIAGDSRDLCSHCFDEPARMRKPPTILKKEVCELIERNQVGENPTLDVRGIALRQRFLTVPNIARQPEPHVWCVFWLKTRGTSASSWGLAIYRLLDEGTSSLTPFAFRV